MVCIVTEIRESLKIYTVVYFGKQLDEFTPVSRLHIIFIYIFYIYVFIYICII